MNRLALALFAFLTCAAPAHAWNARGHMMVATIAWDRLSPDARAKASALIKLNPHYAQWTEGAADADRDLVAFIKASVWADDIRSEAGYSNGPEDTSPPAIGYADRSRHSEWHYKNLAFSPDGTPIKASPESNALSQIHRMTAQLRNPNVSAEARSYDLVWLLHLVGDVTSPCTPRLVIRPRSPTATAAAMRCQSAQPHARIGRDRCTRSGMGLWARGPTCATRSIARADWPHPHQASPA
jgi:hypothetical protein